jgi:hypothetical protein
MTFNERLDTIFPVEAPLLTCALKCVPQCMRCLPQPTLTKRCERSRHLRSRKEVRSLESHIRQNACVLLAMLTKPVGPRRHCQEHRLELGEQWP